jgi:tetratricopeptide (TPR) repeat protein
MHSTSRRPKHPWPSASLPFILCAFALSLTGCQTVKRMSDNTISNVRSWYTSSYHDPRAEEKVQLAEGMMQEGKFKDAETIFADVADNTQNPATLSEKARYYEAECLRQRNNYPDAAATYNRLLKDFPFGAYRERSCTAMYNIAYEWLEQGTLKEIEASTNGNPSAWWERLTPSFGGFDKKKPLFDTEGEALKVLENVQTHDYIGPNADKALFWLGYVHYYRGRFDESDMYFSQLVENYKDSKLRDTAMELAIVAKHRATGGAVYDSQKASEALKLISHTEATMPEFARDPEKKEMLLRQKHNVRMQLADKYLEQAKYYERTGHPASAYFYYDLVTRQHKGTQAEEVAKARMVALEPLRQQAQADAAAGKKPGLSWFRQAEDAWDSVWMKRPKDNGAPVVEEHTEPQPMNPGAPQTLPESVRVPNP